MSGPLVTIGIPTYNRADGYLRVALASALAQDYPDLEIVVSDNASTDATPELVRSMGDERVRYVRQETNIGGLGNFNACLENARGTYFVLLHDDDRLDPGFVSTCMAALERRRQHDPNAELPSLIRTGTRVIDGSGSQVSERRNRATSGYAADLILSWFHRQTSMYFCSTLYNTDLLRRAGGFASPYGLYIDVIAAIRVASERPVLDVPDVLASFRRHNDNNGSLNSIEAWCEDSLFMLDLVCEKAPERAETLRRVGLRYLTSNNYSRVTRLPGFMDRVRAYWIVYRYFGRRFSPLRYVAVRKLRRWRQALVRSTA